MAWWAGCDPDVKSETISGNLVCKSIKGEKDVVKLSLVDSGLAIHLSQYLGNKLVEGNSSN